MDETTEEWLRRGVRESRSDMLLAYHRHRLFMRRAMLDLQRFDRERFLREWLCEWPAHPLYTERPATPFSRARTTATFTVLKTAIF